MSHRNISGISYVISLMLVGCAGPTSTAIKDVRDALKDGDSAKFEDVQIRHVKTSMGGKLELVCGKVNAKNSYGAYDGYHPFFKVISHTFGPPGHHVFGGFPGSIEHENLPAGELRYGQPSTDEDAKVLCDPGEDEVDSDGVDLVWYDPCGGPAGTAGSTAWQDSWIASRGEPVSLVCSSRLSTQELVSLAHHRNTAYYREVDHLLSLRAQASREAAKLSLERIQSEFSK